MKRIVVWIDSKDEDVERVCRKLEKFLKSIDLSHKILDPCELACVSSGGK
jgi:hypothetical protein